MGHIDKTGKVIIDFNYSFEPDKGLALRRRSNWSVWIYKTGKYIWEPTNKEIK